MRGRDGPNGASGRLLGRDGGDRPVGPAAVVALTVARNAWPNPDIRIDTTATTVEEAADPIVARQPGDEG